MMVDEQERAFWDVPDFRDVINRLMDERGIESLEELHRRVVESGYGGIDRYDRNTSLWRFELHVNGETGALSQRFIRALDYILEPTKEERAELLRAYYKPIVGPRSERRAEFRA